METVINKIDRTVNPSYIDSIISSMNLGERSGIYVPNAARVTTHTITSDYFNSKDEDDDK